MKIKLLIYGILSAACVQNMSIFSTDVMPAISYDADPIVQRAKVLIQNHKDQGISIPIIALGGCSSAGKTTFAQSLQQKFQNAGIVVAILHQDHFMDPLSDIPDHGIHPHLDHKKIYEFLNAIKQRSLELNKPRFDWSKREIIYEKFNLHEVDLILFEGTYVLCDLLDYNFLPFSDLRLFLLAQEDDIIAWNWHREMTQDHRPPRSREKFDKDIAWDMKDYRNHILPTKKNADFVIEIDSQRNYTVVGS